MISRAVQMWVGLAVALCLASGAAVASPPEREPGDLVASSDLAVTATEDAVEAQLRFGLALYRELVAAAPGKNVFVSPASVYTALAMAFNGAEGATKEAMEQVLGLEGVSLDALNEALRTLLDGLEAEGDGGVRLHIANGLWYRKGVPFHPGFLARMEDAYQAEIAPLDFRAPGSPAVVNEWVSKKTNGLIRDLIDQFDPDTLLLLVNTVYFKGAWTHPFDVHATRSLPFYLPSGGLKEVPMMYRDGRIQHLDGDGFQAIRLPYGDDEALAMYVFLPDAGSDLAAFHELLTVENWKRWMDAFQAKQGQVYLPRIEIEYKATLNQVLSDLGMGIAFVPRQADFRGMLQAGAENDVSISEVVHQAVLKVDEEGTEAAAATSIGFRTVSLPVYQFTFRADRPFFLAIRDEASGALLFAGAILDPGTP